MQHQNITASQRQKSLSILAAAFFGISGTGAGIYFTSFIANLLVGGVDLFTKEPIPHGFLACIAVLTGFLFIAGEAGKPLRGIRAILNLEKSWISRELLMVIILITSVATDHIWPSLTVRIISLAAAFSMLICQGFVVNDASAIFSWNVRCMPIIFILSSLLSGYGLLILLFKYNAFLLLRSLVWFGIILLMLNIGSYMSYMFSRKRADIYRATASLRNPFIYFINLGIGAVLPLILLFSMLGPIENVQSEFIRESIVTICGITILCAGISHKASIILLSGFTRENYLSTVS